MDSKNRLIHLMESLLPLARAGQYEWDDTSCAPVCRGCGAREGDRHDFGCQAENAITRSQFALNESKQTPSGESSGDYLEVG